MKTARVSLFGLAFAGLMVAGCGGGGSSSPSDFIYYASNGFTLVREDFPTGNAFTSGTGPGMSRMRLSPDKSQILFVSNNQLYLINANGTGLTTLTGFRNGDWNGDGSKIFGISTTGFKVRSVNPDGTGVSGDLFDGNFGGGIQDIDVNDQGTKIAIDYVPTGFRRIYTMNLDGSSLFAVTANTIDSMNMRWSPNGASFVFTRNDDIYTIDADGTDEGILANTAAIEGQAGFRDANTIVYAADGDIWRMAADGTGQTKIIDTAATLTWPVSKN